MEEYMYINRYLKHKVRNNHRNPKRFENVSKIIVTRHPALAAYLHEKGLVEADTPIITHVFDPEEIKGKHVFGVLPFHLCALCAKITNVPLNLSLEQRGSELTLEAIRKCAMKPVTYVIKEVE